MKAELKTKKTAQSVSSFIDSIKDPLLQRDCRVLASMMERATGAKGRMWGSIVGFKDIHVRYASGRELDWFALGFAPRKGNLSLYLGCGAIDAKTVSLLSKLGPHRRGVGCLYLKSLAEVDRSILERVIRSAAVANAKPAQQPAPSRSAAPSARASSSRIRSGRIGSTASKRPASRRKTGRRSRS